MSKTVRLFLLAAICLAVCAAPSFAQKKSAKSVKKNSKSAAAAESKGDNPPAFVNASALRSTAGVSGVRSIGIIRNTSEYIPYGDPDEGQGFSYVTDFSVYYGITVSGGAKVLPEIYIPKKNYPSGIRNKIQGLTQCFGDLNNLNDMEKIYAFPVQEHQGGDAYKSFKWDAVSTAGVPVRDCAVLVLKNAEDNSLIAISEFDSVSRHAPGFIYSYGLNDDGSAVKFDLHFQEGRPGKIRFFLTKTGCCVPAIDAETFNGGIAAIMNFMNGQSCVKDSVAYSDEIAIRPYEIMNYTWEIKKDMFGNPFKPNGTDDFAIGILIESNESAPALNAGFREGAITKRAALVLPAPQGGTGIDTVDAKKEIIVYSTEPGVIGINNAQDLKLARVYTTGGGKVAEVAGAATEKRIPVSGGGVFVVEAHKNDGTSKAYKVIVKQ